MIDVLLNRYELWKLIGLGGMARVYTGFDRVLARRVAVKVLRDDVVAMPDVRERFIREARTAAAFNHLNAVAIFDAGQDGRTAFIVMEFIDGGSLADQLADGPLSPWRALAISRGVLAALQAGHQEGLVHRDVKPANILLPPGGGVKLADFGIAKSTMDSEANITDTGLLIGTPRYLSPEQVRGQPATPQSDLYSLGVVLYEMLAGRPPFDDPTPVAVAWAHQNEPPPPLLEARPGLDPAVAAVVEKALQKDTEQRYAHAGEMLDDLVRLDPVPTVQLAGAPGPVAPRPAPARPRERRVPVAALILGALLALGAPGSDAGVRTEPLSARTPVLYEFERDPLAAAVPAGAGGGVPTAPADAAPADPAPDAPPQPTAAAQIATADPGGRTPTASLPAADPVPEPIAVAAPLPLDAPTLDAPDPLAEPLEPTVFPSPVTSEPATEELAPVAPAPAPPPCRPDAHTPIIFQDCLRRNAEQPSQ